MFGDVLPVPLKSPIVDTRPHIDHQVTPIRKRHKTETLHTPLIETLHTPLLVSSTDDWHPRPPEAHFENSKFTFVIKKQPEELESLHSPNKHFQIPNSKQHVELWEDTKNTAIIEQYQPLVLAQQQEEIEHRVFFEHAKVEKEKVVTNLEHEKDIKG